MNPLDGRPRGGAEGCRVRSEQDKNPTRKINDSQSVPSDLKGLARRVRPAAVWDDLVLPEERLLILREVAVHARHGLQIPRETEPGVKSVGRRGLSALFIGPEGTDKALAAEVVVGEMRRELYRVNMAKVFRVTPEELENNLSHLFSAAEAEKAVVVFGRAETIFGSRGVEIPLAGVPEEDGEQRPSHDSSVPQTFLSHVDAFPGLVILVTKSGVDLPESFMRQMSFVLSFPFPDAAQREAIWRRVFSSHSATHSVTKGLDFPRLARLELPGVYIRDIALHATFLAAEQKQPVNMQHLRRAAQNLYARIGRPMTVAEFQTWT
jgi:SpoVK/Ycf46/Vps4 family AAA+-type ATPase